MRLEDAHGLLDAAQEVARPRDVARDGRQVARDGWRVLVFLVQVLDRLELAAVRLEDERHLAVQVLAHGLALQDEVELTREGEDAESLVLVRAAAAAAAAAAHLGEEAQRRVDRRDGREAQVDELLQLQLQLADPDVQWGGRTMNGEWSAAAAPPLPART